MTDSPWETLGPLEHRELALHGLSYMPHTVYTLFGVVYIVDVGGRVTKVINTTRTVE